MKKSIRRNVYETNSSSTHSICITKNNVLDNKLKSIKFSIGEFGWECDTLTSTYEKASYLYTGILYTDKNELLENIKEILDANNIKYEFEKPIYNEYSNGEKYLDYGYIDHGSELYDFFDICKDENKLMKFLFSSESFIITGNDNDDLDVDINVSYDHEEYYKGN